MKNQILTLFIFLNLAAFAQEPLTGSVSYKNQLYDAAIISFPASTDYIKDAWEDFAKDRFGHKPKGHGFLANKDVLRIEDEVIEGWSTQEANLYAMVITDATGATSLRVFMNLGKDNKVSPNNANDALFEKLKKSVQDFAKSTNEDWYAEVLDNERKAIKDAEKELKRTSRDLEKAEKNLEKNTEDITDLEQEILDLEAENLELSDTIGKKKDAKTGLAQKLEERRRNLDRLIQERDKATGK